MDGIEVFEKKNRRVLGLMLCVLVLLGACNSNSSNTPTDPDPVDPVEVVSDFFSGELKQGGRECHDFTVNAVGPVTLEITELAPLLSLTLGLGLGQPAEIDPEICSIIAEDRSVHVFEIFLSEGVAAGVYCVCIFDVGNIFPDVTVEYTIESIHP